MSDDKYTIREITAEERREFLAATPDWPYLDPPRFVAEEGGSCGVGPTRAAAFRALRVAQKLMEPN